MIFYRSHWNTIAPALGRAEEGYRAIFAREPQEADALHWLGVLYFQAGQLGEAIGFLEAAVRARPGDAAFAQFGTSLSKGRQER